MSKEFYYALGKTITWPNFPGNFPPPSAITYDDVLLVPQTDTKIESRTKPDLSIKFGPFNLKIPVVSAPMDTVSGETMIRELAHLGAIGSLPRNKNINESLKLCERFSQDKIPCLYSIGLKNALEEAFQFKKRGAQMILLDLAHGGMEKVRKTAGEIKGRLGLSIVAGNIVTYEQAEKYQESGVDIARVGVGPGGVCKTRLVAGTGFPQMSAIFETVETGIYVIADGGVRYPGDAAKALAAGAKMLMIGSMLAATDETPGEIIDGQKILRGQASGAYMQENGVEEGEYRAAEGIETMVPVRGPVRNIIYEICGGIRSAMAYIGASNIEEFQKKAVFNLVSFSAAVEGQPHVLK